MIKLASIVIFLVVASPSLALADDQGAMTGAAGGAVAGAVVGGPVGAVVGGAAGAVMGGAATGPNRAVVVEPGAPCASRTTQTTDNTGYSQKTTTTNCP
jgi:outer membrane lipoprotein SlyB